jgi:NAD(P)H-dependent flavin oxidoreductase YrpB (nitropropane dioxygenase family)
LIDRVAERVQSSLHTSFCDLVGIDYPIVQTGMGFVSDATLSAATSGAGGLGIIAAAMMNLDELESSISLVQETTSKPFGVNLRSDAPDIHERVKIMIQMKVRVASFALAPSRSVIDELKEAGVVCMPSIGARRHAEKVSSWGVDALIVQGGEGGGHTGAVPTSVLLPQVVDSVDIPVIAAGGFFDGRGLVSALAYGADGIAMGTRFLLTQESPVHPAIKQSYLEKSVDSTIVTTRVDGAPHRMIRTPFVESLEAAGVWSRLENATRNAIAFKRMSGRRWSDILRQGVEMRRTHNYSWDQIVTTANAPVLCKAAMVDGREDLGILSSGQVVGLIEDIPTCAELVGRIVWEATEVLERLNGHSSIMAESLKKVTVA